LIAAGKKIYNSNCLACHGATGKGNKFLGAPNLTDKAWLYGGTLRTIRKSIAYGRKGKMPAHKTLLSPAKIHLLTAYVYSLSASSPKKKLLAKKEEKKQQ